MTAPEDALRRELAEAQAETNRIRSERAQDGMKAVRRDRMLRERIELDRTRIAALEADVARLTEERDEARREVFLHKHTVAVVEEQREDYRDKAKAAEAQLAAAKAQVARMSEALKPFADEAEHYDPDEGDSYDVAWNSDFPIGALRRARAALNGGPDAEPR